MIRITNLSKSYGKHKVVDNVSLEIKKGSVFGFLGPNGAGKTTTIKMIVGLAKIDKGSVTINKKSPASIITRQSIGFMPENPYFYDHLTGLEMLKFLGQLFQNIRQKNKGYYINILKKVGIYEARNKMIRTYSKGMKQRFGIAQAIVNNPDYIFLDEPLDGLDPIGRREIKKVIQELKNQGKTIFFNSHILTDVEEICDQIGIINQGKLIYWGSVKRFCRKKPLEKAFVDIIERNIHRKSP